jgi:hypothetical protein
MPWIAHPAFPYRPCIWYFLKTPGAPIKPPAINWRPDVEEKMMRIGLHAASLMVFVLVCVTAALAQAPNGNAQSVEGLRAQLLDLEAKEAALQARKRQLDEDLLPENIERSMALTGSTRPEELREQRRRQLEAEKARVRAQLDLLATSRARLETAIATAEATEAYRQGVAASVSTSLANANIAPASSTVRGQPRPRARRQRSVRHRRRSLPRRHR